LELNRKNPPDFRQMASQSPKTGDNFRQIDFLRWIY
jgi:hypothetical protein